jgi:HEAT repeat protein
VAAHITAAAPGGKRYDASLSSEQRKSIENGIWLCQNCGKRIDSDEQKYSVALLVDWKREAERRASLEIENSISLVSQDISSGFGQYLQKLIDRPQIWWLDEINDSTWHEFELFTKVQEKSEQPGGGKPQELPKPLVQAINDGENRSILITGAPGAGKSTFLEKLAIEAARKAQREHNAPIPVLVKLKDYDSSGEQPGIRGLIQSTLESYDLSLDSEATKQLLQGKGRKLLLLIDGWNELSDEQAKSRIKTFCQPHSVIVTSRNAGDYWEIQQKFEIQPLSRSDVEGFFNKRLPNTERQRLQELVDRVRDFGQTPLMVWMLFSIFQNNDPTPATRGEAYQYFTNIYEERAKQGGGLEELQEVMRKLAFEMTSCEQPPIFLESQAKDLLTPQVFQKLQASHLLQMGKHGKIKKVQFCHPSLQEFYAAEYLRRELEKHRQWLVCSNGNQFTDFQIHYLNYIKWTEPIAIMLGLPEVSQQLAEQVVELALDVDLMLGARLAGEVSQNFQEQTVKLLSDHWLKNGQEICARIRIELLARTKSSQAVPLLRKFIDNDNYSNDGEYAARALGKIGCDEAIDALKKAVRHPHWMAASAAVEALKEINTEKVLLALSDALSCQHESVICDAVDAISSINSELIIPILKKVILRDDCGTHKRAIVGLEKFIDSEETFESLIVCISSTDEEARLTALNIIEKHHLANLIPYLLRLVEDLKKDPWERERVQQIIQKLNKQDSTPKKAPLKSTKVSLVLRKIALDVAIPKLEDALKHKLSYNRWEAAILLGELGSTDAVSALIETLKDENQTVRQYSAKSLGKIGSKLAVPALIDALQDTDGAVYYYAAEALGKIASEESILALVTAWEDGTIRESDLVNVIEKIEKDTIVCALPHFSAMLPAATDTYILRAIAAIQANCKFYNYSIKNEKLEIKNEEQGFLSSQSTPAQPS